MKSDKQQLSDLQLANVEALAGYENSNTDDDYEEKTVSTKEERYLAQCINKYVDDWEIIVVERTECKGVGGIKCQPMSEILNCTSERKECIHR